MSIASNTVTTAAEAAHAVAAVAGQGYLGCFVWYEFKSDITLKVDEVRAAFDSKGLDHKYLPEASSPREVFTRCLKRCTNGVRDTISVIRLKRESSYEYHGIYPVTVAGKDLKDLHAELGEPLAKVAYFEEDPQTGKPSVRISADHPVARALKEAWEEQCDILTSSELSAMVRNALWKWGRIRLKRQGHCYFVPWSHHEELERLEEVVASFGLPDTAVSVVPVPVVSKGTIGRAAAKGFEARFKELADKVEAFGERTREATKVAAIEEAKNLRDQVGLYKDIAGGLVEKMHGMTAALEAKVRELLEVN